MPTPRDGLAVAVMDDKIFALGGYACCQETHKFDAYDPATDTWTTKANALANSAYTAVGVSSAGTRPAIYAAGGLDGANYLTTVEAFSP